MLRHFAILGLLALANARWMRPKADHDLKTRGGNTVINCEGDAEHTLDLLDKLSTSLLPAIADAQFPNPSPAYKTFFKDSSSATFVASLLRKITTGVPNPVSSTLNLAGGGNYVARGLNFVCVRDYGAITWERRGPQDAYTMCLANPDLPSMYIVTQSPKPVFVLCPAFFNKNIPAVPLQRRCLAVSTYVNRFRGNGSRIWDYQLWILLAMILQYQLHTATGKMDGSAQITDINKCFLLTPEESRSNAFNYVYYVASIYSSCTSFPSPSDHGREILAIGVVDTPGEGNDGGVSGSNDWVIPANGTEFATDLAIGGQLVNGTGAS